MKLIWQHKLQHRIVALAEEGSRINILIAMSNCYKKTKTKTKHNKEPVQVHAILVKDMKHNTMHACKSDSQYVYCIVL